MPDLSYLLSWEALASLLVLTILEIVLGIDNIVFISILSEKLPADQQDRARKIGLGAALVSRVLLLFAITWVMRLTTELWGFDLFGHHFSVSGQSLVLLIGGLFLVYKASHEIHINTNVHDEPVEVRNGKVVTFGAVIAQIALLDIVFSLDSVITAVGMAQHIEIMIAAVIIAIVVMMVFATPLSEFISKNRGFKMLALSFLLTIGVLLIAESMAFEVPKGVVYFAMAFSVFVEFLEMRADRAADAMAQRELAKEAVSEGRL